MGGRALEWKRWQWNSSSLTYSNPAEGPKVSLSEKNSQVAASMQTPSANYVAKILHHRIFQYTPDRPCVKLHSCVIFVVGLIAFALGSYIWWETEKVIQCAIVYPDPSPECLKIPTCYENYTAILTENECEGTILMNTLRPPIYVYYRLNNSVNTYWTVSTSKHELQLAGKVVLDTSELRFCRNRLLNTEGQILSPCGLAPYVIFSDRFAIYDGSGQRMKTVEDVSLLGPDVAKANLYRNPVLNETSRPLIDEWLSEDVFPGKVENFHFISGMQSTIHADSTVLYARIDDPLTLPVKVVISNRYHGSRVQSDKQVIITTVSRFGGRNHFLGLFHIVLSTLCFIRAATLIL